MRCPKCGYTDEQPRTVKQVPDWMWSLRYIAVSQVPLFSGLLENDKWRQDKQIVDFLNRGWIERDGDKGFRITKSGVGFLRQAGLLE